MVVHGAVRQPRQHSWILHRGVDLAASCHKAQLSTEYPLSWMKPLHWRMLISRTWPVRRVFYQSYNSLWIHIRSSSFLCFIIVVVRKQQTEITHVVGHSACHAVHCVLAWALIEGKWSVLREMSYVCTYNPLLLIPPKFVMFMLSAIQWITRVDRSQIWRHERHTPS